eukprot:gene13271-9113_t
MYLWHDEMTFEERSGAHKTCLWSVGYSSECIRRALCDNPVRGCVLILLNCLCFVSFLPSNCYFYLLLVGAAQDSLEKFALHGVSLYEGTLMSSSSSTEGSRAVNTYPNDNTHSISSTDSSSVHGIFVSLYAEQEQRRQRFLAAVGHTPIREPLEPFSAGTGPTPHRRPSRSQRSDETEASATKPEEAAAGGTASMSGLSQISDVRREEAGHTHLFSTDATLIEKELAQIPLTVRVEFQPGKHVGPAARSGSGSGRSTPRGSAPYVPGEDIRSALRRQARHDSLHAEVERERMMDCTFHPVVTPLARAAAAGRSRPAHERLYPGLEGCRTSSTALLADREKKEKEYEREEQMNLRAHCGGFTWKPTNKEEAFDLFLSNMLGTDCRHCSFEDLKRKGCAVDVPYRFGPDSANAVVANRSRSPSPTHPVGGAGGCRIAMRPKISTPRAEGSSSPPAASKEFQGFLDRQKKFLYSRSEKMRSAVREVTPSFRPQTTAKSAQLRDQIIERSLKSCQSGEDSNRSSLERLTAAVEQHQALHLPLSYVVLPRSKTPNPEEQHADPSAEFSFQPKISAWLRGPSSSRDRCESLYMDHTRRDRRQRQAQEAAKQGEVEGLTFNPKLNANRKSGSMLNTANYEKYKEMRKRKEEMRQQQREALEREREAKELEQCTFHPRTNKLPGYLSRSATDYSEMEKRVTLKRDIELIEWIFCSCALFLLLLIILTQRGARHNFPIRIISYRLVVLSSRSEVEAHIRSLSSSTLHAHLKNKTKKNLHLVNIFFSIVIVLSPSIVWCGLRSAVHSYTVLLLSFTHTTWNGFRRRLRRLSASQLIRKLYAPALDHLCKFYEQVAGALDFTARHARGISRPGQIATGNRLLIPSTSGTQNQARRTKRGSETGKYMLKPLSPRISACQVSPQPAVGSTLERVMQSSERIFNSIPNKTDTFRYFQRLQYPFDSSATVVKQTSTARREFERIVNESREVLPGENGGSEEEPQSPNEEDLQSVTALALSTFSDPVSGAPVFSVLVGDYSGHIEYVEVSACNESNRLIKRSKTVISRTENHRQSVSSGEEGMIQNQLTEAASAGIAKDLRGREVVRRVSHSAYIKSINALTSVAVEPGVKCLSFVPHTSPSTLSYLTANQRVVKLFRIRREGFSPLDYFPEVEEILRRYQDPVPRYSRFPPPQSILPVKEFGPATNSIQQLSLSADCQTFMSIEDLQIFWWDMEASDTTKGACIVDLNPPSGDLNEVEELVTAANFHPTHGSLFLMSRSSGALNIGDLRDPPCRSERKFAISTKVLPHQNPVSSSPFDEILCSISSAAFLGNDHVVTRDYLSMKVWDLRKASVPFATAPVMKYMSPFLEQLYENDCIFDRFPLALDNASRVVVTGMYDGAVTVWQPLPSSSSCDALQYYKADPQANPDSPEISTGRVSMNDLQRSTEAGFQMSPTRDRNVVPELLNNKVLCLDIAPGGERFAYGSKDGRQVFIFERDRLQPITNFVFRLYTFLERNEEKNEKQRYQISAVSVRNLKSIGKLKWKGQLYPPRSSINRSQLFFSISKINAYIHMFLFLTSFTRTTAYCCFVLSLTLTTIWRFSFSSLFFSCVRVQFYFERMSIPGYGLVDPFRGLRELPKTAEELRHHLSKIHHTLQTTYFVDPDTAHYVLQPEKTEEFYQSYTHEVEKIIRHLSKVSRRSIKTRVNPQRNRRGFEILHQQPSQPTSSSSWNTPEDSAWVEQVSCLGKKLQEAELLESFRQSTPEAQPPNASALDSDARLHKNSGVFCTPPEFKGFTVSGDLSWLLPLLGATSLCFTTFSCCCRDSNYELIRLSQTEVCLDPSIQGYLGHLARRILNISLTSSSPSCFRKVQMLLEEEEDILLAPPSQKRRVEQGEGEAVVSSAAGPRFNIKGGDGLAKMSLLCYGSPPVEVDAASACSRPSTVTCTPTPRKEVPISRVEPSELLCSSSATPERLSGSASAPGTVAKPVYKAESLASSPRSLADTPLAGSPTQLSVGDQSPLGCSPAARASQAEHTHTPAAKSSAVQCSSSTTTQSKSASTKPQAKQMKLSDFFSKKHHTAVVGVGGLAPMKSLQTLSKNADVLQRVASILSEARGAETVTLRLGVWLDLLDRMEQEVSAVREPETDFRRILLTHYHQLYMAAVGCVPLPLSMWQQWRKGLETVLGLKHTTTAPLELVRTSAELLKQFHAKYRAHFWGCRGVVGERLADLLQECRERSETVQDDIETIADLEAAYGAEMQSFSRLCSDAAHLFLDYPIIGREEREFWSGALTSDVVMESALRHSFKRDARTPSSALVGTELLEEYEEFEVDDKKGKEVKQLFSAATRSGVQRALDALYQHMSARVANKSSDSSAMASGTRRSVGFLYPLLDEEENKLADEVVELWRRVPESCYTALAFTMQRLVELESFPGVLNPSRLLFALNLLHRWWTKYTAQLHRWSAHSPFVAEDDSDVWQFLLERHEVLLLWGLAYYEYSADPSEKVEALSAVSQSLVHCLFTYLSNVEGGHMTAAKAARRSNAAVSACLKWLNDVAVDIIAVALMNDTYRYAESMLQTSTFGSSEQEQDPNSVPGGEEDSIVLPREVRLKLVLLDTWGPLARFSSLQCEKNAKRITAMASGLLEYMTRPGLAEEQRRHLWNAALRVLQRGSQFLPFLDISSAGSETKEFVRTMMRLFKELLCTASDHLKAPELVEFAADAWRAFASCSIRATHVAATEGGDAPLPSVSISYDPALRRCGQGGTAFAATLMDVAIERRKGLKQRYLVNSISNYPEPVIHSSLLSLLFFHFLYSALVRLCSLSEQEFLIPIDTVSSYSCINKRMEGVRRRSNSDSFRGGRKRALYDDGFESAVGSPRVPEASFRPFDSPDGHATSEQSSSIQRHPSMQPIMCETAAINNYQYMIGANPDDLPGSAYQHVCDDLDEGSLQLNTTFASDKFESATFGENLDLVEKFKKSFAFSQHPGAEGKPAQPSLAENEERHGALPLPYTESCVSSNDLNFDGMEIPDFWLAFKSSSVIQNAIFGFRVMFFAVLPAFVLVENKSTSGYFAAGLLLPTFAAALALPNLGLQCQMTVMMIQTSFVLFLWGTFVQMTNMAEHRISWWFAMFLICFLLYLMGDLPAKRIMMVFVIMVMESELQLKPSPESHFPRDFARDFVFAAMFPQIAAIIPFPIFAYRVANNQMKALHNLYAAALGNAMKSFWAPVLIDAEIARSQIPWVKIRDCTTLIQMLMKAIAYEPVEFGLKNIFRGERLDHLSKVRWCIYSLAASSSLHSDLRQISLLVPFSDDLKQSQKRMQDLAFRLSAELMRVLSELGEAICPEEVKKIDFALLAELGTAMDDLIKQERENTLLSKKFSVTETNYIIRTFSFHFTVIKIVGELLKVEAWAVNFDRSKYPTFLQRAFRFTVGDYWRDFWIELPKRLTLASPRDVRMVKDGIRYSLGFTVAVGFTLITSKSEIYYFGMAILARIAQQTASETLQIGIMRICGLAFGASFAHLISRTTTELWQSSMMMVTLGFFCVTIQQHALYGQVGQYAVITLIAGIPIAQQSTEKLMNRVTDNVFAFSFYLIICLVVFPVDPIRVVRNYRTKCMKAANEVTQNLMVLGCCPITQNAEEAKSIIAEAEKIMAEQHNNLLEAQAWNAKAAVEPALRGEVFPDKASGSLIIHLAEFSSLQESLLDSMKLLHRTRTTDPSRLIREILELIRPFLLDAGRLIQRYLQLLIDAAEKPFEWSLEKTALQVWRCELSILSIRKVMGNVQLSFIAALLPDRQLDTSRVTQYVNATAMEAAVMQDNMRDLDTQGSFAIQTLMGSFRQALVKAVISREDLCVFESICGHFALMMRTIANCLKHAIDIHSYEQSRRL